MKKTTNGGFQLEEQKLCQKLVTSVQSATTNKKEVSVNTQTIAKYINELWPKCWGTGLSKTDIDLVKTPTMEVAGSMRSSRETQKSSTILVMFYFLSCKVGVQIFTAVLFFSVLNISFFFKIFFTKVKKENPFRIDYNRLRKMWPRLGWGKSLASVSC